MASPSPEPPAVLQQSQVDMSTFIDVMKQEDTERFEKMFMTQDDPSHFFPQGIDRENTEEVYEYITAMVPDMNQTQFQMLHGVLSP